MYCCGSGCAPTTTRRLPGPRWADAAATPLTRTRLELGSKSGTPPSAGFPHPRQDSRTWASMSSFATAQGRRRAAVSCVSRSKSRFRARGTPGGTPRPRRFPRRQRRPGGYQSSPGPPPQNWARIRVPPSNQAQSAACLQSEPTRPRGQGIAFRVRAIGGFAVCTLPVCTLYTHVHTFLS